MATTDRSPGAILAELARHPHGLALSELVHTLAASAFDEGRAALDTGLEEAAARVGVDQASAETSVGNVLVVLKKREGCTAAERTLLGALVARGVAAAAPPSEDARARVAESLAWLSAHTHADPLSALDAALPDGELKDGLVMALSDLVAAHVDGRPRALDRASAVLSALALARSSSPAATRARAELASLADPTLLAILGPPPARAAASQLVVTGEETSAPRNAFLTLALTVTLLLPLWSAAKLFGRYALRLRRPTELAFSREGVTIRSKLEVLGKIVRERETFLAASSLVRAAREVRYPRLATYLGIGCLLVGSYIGLRQVLDGLRSGSPELLGLGVAVLFAALVADYGLSLLPARSSDRCRIVLEPRRGRVVAVAFVERAKAEAALQALKA